MEHMAGGPWVFVEMVQADIVTWRGGRKRLACGLRQDKR